MHLRNLFLILAVTLASTAMAVAANPLAVTVEGVDGGKPIPEKFALCKATKDGKSTNGANLRPNIAWSGAPEGTQSYAIIVHDTDVPRDFTNAGKEGVTLKASQPRQDFYHWGLVDIPSDKLEIKRGLFSQTVGFGKAVVNDLGAYMPDATEYGGPCPPWNDARLHHYHFTVYALSVPSLNLPENATAKDAATALKRSRNILARGEAIGTYTLNKDLLAALK